MISFEQCRQSLAAYGLVANGFHPASEDGPPPGTGTLIIASAASPQFWGHFQSAPEYSDGAPDPLNRWSARVIGAIAAELGAGAAFPFTYPPYWPFLQWSRQATPLWPSPVGLHVHSEYGLWFSCRGALLVGERIELPTKQAAASPCESCAGQPCRSACPVNAFESGQYDTGRCTAHILSPEGESCRTHGCLVRRACPIGQRYAHHSERAAFHMTAFLDSTA